MARPPSRPRQLVAGRRFGRWLVESEETDTSKPHTALCRCDCGTVRSVLAQNLILGRSKSCGCLKKEVVGRGARAFWGSGRNRYGEPK
jgi:hypothetical protein